MKFLKGFITFILGLLAFVLIFSLSIIIRTKSFVEKEVLTTIIKETTKEAVKNSNLRKKDKDFIDKIINDKDSSKILNRIEQNYLDYQSDSNYELSKKDYDLLIDFIIKYEDEINDLYKTNYSSEKIRNNLKYDDVNRFAKNSFNELSTSDETKDVNEVLTTYIKLTSLATKILILAGIVILLALVALVNWTPIKCLKVLGIDLIISGALIGLIFGAAQIALQSIVADQEVLDIINNINLNGFIIMAVCEFVIGIISIIVYKKLNKKRISKLEEKPKED